MGLFVIVNNYGEYFERWAARMTPKYDGDDETFVRVPQWTYMPRWARRYESRRAAERASKRVASRAVCMVAVIP
jgi:hypothetical protein